MTLLLLLATPHGIYIRWLPYLKHGRRNLIRKPKHPQKLMSKWAYHTIPYHTIPYYTIIGSGCATKGVHNDQHCYYGWGNRVVSLLVCICVWMCNAYPRRMISALEAVEKGIYTGTAPSDAMVSIVYYNSVDNKLSFLSLMCGRKKASQKWRTNWKTTASQTGSRAPTLTNWAYVCMHVCLFVLRARWCVDSIAA